MPSIVDARGEGDDPAGDSEGRELVVDPQEACAGTVIAHNVAEVIETVHFDQVWGAEGQVKQRKASDRVAEEPMLGIHGIAIVARNRAEVVDVIGLRES